VIAWFLSSILFVKSSWEWFSLCSGGILRRRGFSVDFVAPGGCLKSEFMLEGVSRDRWRSVVYYF
jgi:hypothetical protein